MRWGRIPERCTTTSTRRRTTSQSLTDLARQYDTVLAEPETARRSLELTVRISLKVADKHPCATEIYQSDRQSEYTSRLRANRRRRRIFAPGQVRRDRKGSTIRRIQFEHSYFRVPRNDKRMCIPVSQMAPEHTHFLYRIDNHDSHQFSSTDPLRLEATKPTLHRSSYPRAKGAKRYPPRRLPPNRPPTK